MLAHIDAELFVVGDTCLEVGISCGISLCCGAEIDLETILRRSDIGIYFAKAVGCNAFRLKHKHVSEGTEHNVRLERQIGAWLAMAGRRCC